jgi:beta-glucosidase
MSSLHVHGTREFPEGFLWGTSTAAHQVEGGNVHSDWWAWERIPGKISDGTTSETAADHYRRYEEDLDLAAKMGNNAHRLSVEWARLEPEEGKWDEAEVAHYRKVLEAVRRRGMKVMLTLWHFSLPKWFADRGGWEHPLALRAFVRYVRRATEAFGDLVDFWNTMNEPNVYVAQGYLSGGWPPQKKNFVRTMWVAWVVARAHVAAYRAIKKIHPEAKVGAAQNVLSIEAYRLHSLRDYLGTRIIDWWWNHAFYTFTGRASHDFIGLNYYFHYRLKKFGWPPTAFFTEVRRERRDTSDVGWELNPAGIFKVLKDFEDYRLPIYVTESGLPSANDDRRKRFLVATVKEIWHAIHSGVDVRGYFFWSLIDNWEWEKGFAAKFGLVEVDFATQKRTPRGSYSVYEAISKSNGLPHEMLRYVGHAVDQPYTPLKTGVHARKPGSGDGHSHDDHG